MGIKILLICQTVKRMLYRRIRYKLNKTSNKYSSVSMNFSFVDFTKECSQIFYNLIADMANVLLPYTKIIDNKK